jgi:ribonuclease HI
LYLEKNNILSPYQAGFRKHRSTTDHLLLLDTFIRNAFKNKNHVLAVFFDLEKAYDMAWKYGSLSDLHEAGLRGHLPTFIANFLHQRSFQVRTGTHLSNPQNQENGFPQGSILSVTLFGLRINKITTTLTPQVHNCIFVDDYTIYSMAPTVIAAQLNIQATIDALQAWCTTTGFKFSPAKSQAILFHRPRTKPPAPYLTLNHSPIPIVKNIKYLGLTFDSNLNYHSHINALKTKCLKTLNLLKVLSNTHWGGHQQQLLIIYRALIRSKIDYASFIYNPSTKTPSLNPIIHKALRLCLGAFHTSPVESLYVLADEPPFSIRRDKLALQNITKLAASPNNPTFSSIFPSIFQANPPLPTKLTPPLSTRIAPLLSTILPQTLQILPYIVPPIPPWIIHTPQLILDTQLLTSKISLSPEIINSRFLEILSLHPTHIPIYTDGSKKNNSIGAAAITPTHSLLQKLPPHSSVFTAELSAIQLALSYIQENHNKNYIICSDSKSALTAITSFSHTNPIIIQIKHTLHTLHPTSNIILLWIPSHVGITGNELADTEANNALSLPTHTTSFLHQDLKQCIHDTTTSIWQKRWDTHTNNKLHSLIPLVKHPPFTSTLTRRHQVIANRLMIGHSNLTHSYLLKKEPPPTCTHCQAPLTIHHILTQCTLLSHIRIKHYPHTSIQETLTDTNLPAVINYLQEANLIPLI